MKMGYPKGVNIKTSRYGSGKDVGKKGSNIDQSQPKLPADFDKIGRGNPRFKDFKKMGSSRKKN